MATAKKGKSTSARKKKVKRSFPKGVAHIHATFNNTIISVSDKKGEIIAASSAGANGFRGSKKGTAYAGKKEKDRSDPSNSSAGAAGNRSFRIRRKEICSPI